MEGTLFGVDTCRLIASDIEGKCPYVGQVDKTHVELGVGGACSCH